MDFALLYSAKLITKNRSGVAKITFAATLGGIFAVIFPLIPLNNWLAIAVKIFFALLLSFIAGKFNSFKSYIKFTACFLVLSFILAGALLAICCFTGLEYIEGTGYLISQVPVGIPLFFALLLLLMIKKLSQKIAKKFTKKQVSCRIYAGQSCERTVGFYDSGNCVYYLGSPVCIIDKSVANALVDVQNIKTFVNIQTVAGNKKIAIFTADKIEIDDGNKIDVFYKVKMGVSERRIKCAVLHPDLSEG